MWQPFWVLKNSCSVLSICRLTMTAKQERGGQFSPSTSHVMGEGEGGIRQSTRTYNQPRLGLTPPSGSVPDMETGYCLGLEGNRVSMGEGGEGGPGPPERGKDKQSSLSKGRDNMGEDEENHPSRMLWKRIGANRVRSLLIKLNFVNTSSKILILLIIPSFRRINHIALKPFALILCLPVAEHQVVNRTIHAKQGLQQCTCIYIFFVTGEDKSSQIFSQQYNYLPEFPASMG
jgi:hypothetical protein